jgi:hypothetical protein
MPFKPPVFNVRQLTPTSNGTIAPHPHTLSASRPLFGISHKFVKITKLTQMFAHFTKADKSRLCAIIAD